jgi:serine/threonine protein kinase
MSCWNDERSACPVCAHDGTSTDMQAADHTAIRPAEGWPHPLGLVSVRRLSTATEVLSTVLDATIRSNPQRATAHEEMAAKTRDVGCDRIVQVVGVRRITGERLAFDAQRVPGEPVASRLASGPISPVLATSILIQTAYALAVAHEAEILHGALSTSSVVVEPHSGADVIARVTDFGIGELCWDAHERNPETVPMSPERVLGLDRSPAEDAYHFGCLAYAMLTGRPVFDSGTVEEIRRRHAIEDAPPLPEIGAGATVPTPLRDLVHRCLAKEPEDRFATGTLLLIALREAMAASGLETPFDAIGLPDYTEPSRTTPPPPSQPIAATPARKSKRSPPPQPPPRPTPSSAVPQPEAVPVRRLPTPPPPPAAAAPAVAAVSSVEAEPAPLRPSNLETRTGSKPAKRRGSRSVVVACFGSAALVGIMALWLAMQSGDTEASQPSVAAVQLEREAPRRDPPDETPASEEVAAAEDRPAAIPDVERPSSGTSDGDVPEPTSDAEEVSDLEEEHADEAVPASTSPDQAANRQSADNEAPAAVDVVNVSELVREAKEAQARGDTKRAHELFEDVLANRPRNMAALEALSSLAFNRGDHRAAAGYLTRAVKVSPRNAELRIRLGDAHFKLEQYAKARTHFEKAAKLGHPSAARRLARVEDAKTGS